MGRDRRKIQNGKKAKSEVKMKNARIEVTIGRTINLGDYESIRVQAGLSFDIDPKLDLDIQYDSAWDEVQNEVGIKSKELENELTNKTSRSKRR